MREFTRAQERGKPAFPIFVAQVSVPNPRFVTDRFLLHVLPDGFHRIRHYGFLANGVRVEAVAKARTLLGAVATDPPAPSVEPKPLGAPCPCCGGRVIVVERFARGDTMQQAPKLEFWIDSS